MRRRYKQSLRNALLAPVVGILVLVPLILSVQYYIQINSMREEQELSSKQSARCVADLISFSYSTIAQLYAELLPSVSSVHSQLVAELPVDPAQVDVSNIVKRANTLLPADLHCDVSIVTLNYHILNTTYREELGLDLGQFPDAVAAFSEAASTGEIVPEFPVVDSGGNHIRMYTHSLVAGGGYFVQFSVYHQRADELFSDLKRRITASAEVVGAEVYLYNKVKDGDVAYVFNLQGTGDSDDSQSDIASIVSDLANDPTRISTVIPGERWLGIEYFQQVDLDSRMAGSLPFGAVVRVRLDSSARRRVVSSHIWAILAADVLVFVCLAIGMWSLKKSFYEPIRTLSSHVRSSKPIAPDSPVYTTPEFSLVANQFNEHLERIRTGEAELRSLYEQTEQLVRERTGDLETVNQQLRRSESELRNLSKRLLSVQEDQMRKIALELHDEFGQSIAAMRIMLQGMDKKLRGRDDTEETSELIDRCTSVLDQMMQEVKSLVGVLRPVILDYEGIEKALQWLGTQFKEAGPTISIKAKMDVGTVPKDLETPIFRIAQEALNNAVKHSGATKIDVILDQDRDGRVELLVLDDGVGFELGSDSPSGSNASGVGLVSMRERAHLSGGEIDITASPGGGTHISARWGTAHG